MTAYHSCTHPHNFDYTCKSLRQHKLSQYSLQQSFPTFSTSRYPWPRSSYLTVPLEENTYFLKLIYFLIISYVRDKVVYCCWVSIYAWINDVILFIYFSISPSRGTPRKCSRYPRVPRNPGWESLLYRLLNTGARTHTHRCWLTFDLHRLHCVEANKVIGLRE
jgi:hypothetical protein